MAKKDEKIIRNFFHSEEIQKNLKIVEPFIGVHLYIYYILIEKDEIKAKKYKKQLKKTIKSEKNNGYSETEDILNYLSINNLMK